MTLATLTKLTFEPSQISNWITDISRSSQLDRKLINICFSNFSVFPNYGTIILNYNITLFFVYNDKGKARPISSSTTHSNTGKIEWRNVIVMRKVYHVYALSSYKLFSLC